MRAWGDLGYDLVKFLTKVYAMPTVSIYEAKARLSALIEAGARGEEVVITNRNRPVARLIPTTPRRERPVFGSAKAAVDRSGLTEADIERALAPLAGEELRDEWGID